MKEFKTLLLLFIGILSFTSCDETKEPGEYDNWQERNVSYIDSIATVARANADSTWAVFLATGLDTEKQWGNEYYIYCQKLNDVEGTHPLYTDTVLVNYSGRLIPTKSYPNGFVFDSSYDGEFDPLFDVPVKFPLAGTIAGFSTALQQMSAGSRWLVYIPYTLGYGSTATSGVPAFSTLIFDINLVAFAPVGTPLPQK